MTHEEELERIHLLYRLLVEELVMGHSSIEHELQQPKFEQDAYYMLGQAELNSAFSNAAIVLENSGLIADDEMLCHSCSGPMVEHGDGPGDHVEPKKPDVSKPN